MKEIKKPPATPNTKEPAKKQRPDKKYCPTSLPAELCGHQTPTAESLHKPSTRQENETPGHQTQASSDTHQILRGKPKPEAKPHTSR